MPGRRYLGVPWSVLVGAVLAVSGVAAVTAPAADPVAFTFQFPLTGDWNVTRGFARDYIPDPRWGYHLGEDVPRSVGTEVRAAATGILRRAEVIGGLGYAVHIDHLLANDSRVTTIYYHMQRPDEGGLSLQDKIGMTVEQNTPIGYISDRDKDGAEEGSHLHFGVRRGPYQTGDDSRTGKWFYPGYSAIYKNRVKQTNNISDATHTDVVRDWCEPETFLRFQECLTLYDNFDSSSLIDSTRWSPATAANTAASLRQIEAGRLRLRATTLAVGDVITTAVRFVNPAQIRGYSATVSVDNVGAGLADNQVARLIGAFYKSTGNSGGLGRDGDIFAAMRITGNQASGLRASFTMFRCLGAQCTSAPHVFTDLLDSVGIGTRNTLKLLWNGTTFTYGVNGTNRVFNPSSVALVVSQTPGLQVKTLDTQAFFSGTISATFDNVMVVR